MADAQIAIIDGDQTQVVLAPGENPAIVSSIPGPQGPAGAGVPLGGTTNQVLFKQSGTNYDTAWGAITSAMIGDLEIVNADVSASAAIAGTKISPNFGSQNVVTTGTSTAASFIPSSSTVPTNGLYLSASNSVALSTNGTGRLFIDSSGNVGIGAATPVNSANYSSLTLQGTTGGQIALRAGTTLKSYFLNDASKTTIGAVDDFVVATTGSITERLRITSAGLVGIGTSTPSAPLSVVANNVASRGQLSLQTSSASNVAQFTFYNQGNLRFQAYQDYSGNGDINFVLNGASANMGFWTNNLQRLTIDSSGRVGIGNSSPSTVLDVTGQITTRGSIGAVNFEPRDASGAVFSVYNGTGDDLRVFSNSADRVTITAGGLVGIGTTSPEAKIQVLSDTSYSTQGGLTGTGQFSVATSNGDARVEVRNTSGTNGWVNSPYLYVTGGGWNTSLGMQQVGLRIRTQGGVYSSPTIGQTGQVNTVFETSHITGASISYEERLRFASGATSFSIGGSEAARIDSSARLLVGTSTSVGNTFAAASGNDTNLQIVGVTYGTSSLQQIRHGGTTAGASPFIVLGRSRNTTIGTPTVVAADDRIGALSFQGADGTNYVPAAQIEVFVDGTPSSADMPGRLVFSTTSDGQASPTPRLTITSTGQVRLAGAGITFNGDTAAANELDDYEEGTFTPTITGGTTAGTATYSAQVGNYTKIGRQVNFTIYIVWSGGTGTGELRITGLPFAVANLNSWAVSIGIADNVATAANTTMMAYAVQNGSYVACRDQVIGGGGNTATTYDAAGTLLITGSYAA